MSRPLRTRATSLVAGLAVCLMAALSVPVLGGSAHAGQPSKNTTYTDASVDSDDPGSIKIKVGNSTRSIAKLKLVATCADGTKEKLVLKDIRLDDGGFDVQSGPGQGIRGGFKNARKVTGQFRTDLCGFFGGEFTAKR